VNDERRTSFFGRLGLAWRCFLRVLTDARFAETVSELSAGSVEPRRLAPSAPVASPPPVTSSPPAAPAATAALQLLSLLQREGRLVDFLQQDITSFPDADVGAAARVVHEGCRRALRTHARIEPVRAENEGTLVRLEAGFDADRVKLVGDVHGQPPYAGILRHRGWRAETLELPQIMGGHDARVLAPAEVELG
jgi:hypothetical protein